MNYEIIDEHFSQSDIVSQLSQIRSKIQKESKQRLELALVEYYLAEDFKLGKKNIFQIAKAAVQGKVKKLIVADGVQIFGKLDRTTGGLIINPADLDHEDDDLLDDLAQTVLEFGGEVVVVDQNEIPKGRPILAILKSKKQNEIRNHPLNIGEAI